MTAADEYANVLKCLDEDIRGTVALAKALTDFLSGVTVDSTVRASAVQDERAALKATFEDLLAQRVTIERDIRTMDTVLRALPPDATPDGARQAVHDATPSLTEAEVRDAVAASEQCSRFKQLFREAVGGGDGGDDDEEITLVGRNQSLHCPILVSRLVDPVKSTVCGHTYSRMGIMGLFRGQRRVQCPVSGCRKMFTATQLERDEEAVFLLQQDDARLSAAQATQALGVVDVDDEDD